jgi:pimeloyl-ACP methyl ester carboxylesterase
VSLNDIWIETPHGKVYGKSAGERGRPLVLGIHGYSQRNGWHTWEPLMQPLADAGFWVVSVDMPGWGKSAPGNGDPVPTIVAILDGLGMDAASNQPVALMGKSWGGGIALEVALQYPERVDKLILTAPARQNLDPLRNLQQPVLLSWAEDDQVIPYTTAQKYMERIPNIQLETYATGGHSAAQNNVADFAPKAITFLREVW